jgi:hypothetical protein
MLIFKCNREKLKLNSSIHFKEYTDKYMGKYIHIIADYKGIRWIYLASSHVTDVAPAYHTNKILSLTNNGSPIELL